MFFLKGEVQMDFDVLFIGSGQAAWNGAVPMSNNGLKVAVVEEAQYGGVCSNRGCNAKIILDHPIDLLEQVKSLQNRGLDGVPALNWQDLMAHKHELITNQNYHNKERLVANNITTIDGSAKFIDRHTVQVNGKQYTSEKIVIATGLRPNRVNIPGADLFNDSTNFLSINKMPDHITILGAGFVALEFAAIASAAGAKVDVIARSNRILKDFPNKYVNKIVSIMKKQGIRFIQSTVVEQATKENELIVLKGNNGFSLSTNYVLDATGRVPNVEKLNLEKIGITYTPQGIVVNDLLQTSIDNVYAAGDIIDKKMPKLTPVAAFESRYLADQFIKNTTVSIDYPTVSTILFTSPRLAQVGVNLDEAIAHPDLFDVENFDYNKDWYRQKSNESNGELTLIFNKERQLVGAIELSVNAENTINTLVPYIELKLNTQQLNRLIYLFPSIEYTTQRRLSLV